MRVLNRGTAVLRKVGQLSLKNDLDDNTFPYSTLYCVLDVVIHITTLHPPCIRSELGEREREEVCTCVCMCVRESICIYDREKT